MYPTRPMISPMKGGQMLPGQMQHERAESGSQVSDIPLHWLTPSIRLFRRLVDGVFYDCNHTLMCIIVFESFFF